MASPQYNGVNPNYPGLRMLHANPPVFCVDNFLNDYECDFLVHSAQDAFGPAPVVGKGVGEVSPSRTSSTCYLAREDLPDYMRKVSLLTGKPVEHCELPQVGRYYPSEHYLQVSHLYVYIYISFLSRARYSLAPIMEEIYKLGRTDPNYFSPLLILFCSWV
jgi:hypothetical protein